MTISGSTAVVTGADGFIGSHLVERLIRQGCKVRALAFYNSFGSWGWLDSLSADVIDDVEILLGDVRDAERVDELVQGADLVFHLAALIGIPYSYHAPRSYVETNVTGTLNVLQASRKHSVRRVLVTSTSEVYGTARTVPIAEDHPLQAQSPYAASKIAADRLAESFFRSFDLPVIIVRPFNTYGPRQSARAVIPTIIGQLAAGSTVVKLGNLSPTRDFNFVLDTVEGFVALAESDTTVGEEVNIATTVEISIGDLAHELITQMNPNATIQSDSQRLRPERSEVDRLLGDSQKIRRLSGWSPKFDLAAGLKRTIDWFRQRENLSRYKTGIYNV